MPGYVPVLAGATTTLAAAARIGAGDPLTVAGSGQVARPVVAGQPHVGIAMHDAGPGADVTVMVAGPSIPGCASAR